MRSPLEDTIWGAAYGSVQAVEAAFARFGPEYHAAILASGVPAGAAAALLPYLDPEARGLDLGCGSGALGVALRDAGWRAPMDGVDLSGPMLALAESTGCYAHLYRANLLSHAERLYARAGYDFVVTVGLIGDYVPYYVGLPEAVLPLRPGGILAFAAETRSTPWRFLEKLAVEFGLEFLAETELVVPEGALCAQVYRFYVARLAATQKTPGETGSTGAFAD